MRTSLALATAVATLVAVPTAALATTGAPALASAPVAGSAPLQVAGATDLGTAPDATSSVVLGLPLRHRAALDALLAHPHATLTAAQFAAGYAPTAASAASVTRWAAAHGLHATTSADRLLVTVSGARSALGSALGVRFDAFRLGAQSWIASVGTARVPAGVTSVTGLSTAGAVRPQARTAGLTYPTSYTPQQLTAHYNGSSAPTGSGQALSVIAEGDLTQVQKDLRTFEARYGLPQVPWVAHQVGAPSTDTTGADEYDLDTQWSSAMAPGAAALNVFDGPSLSNADIAATIDAWATSGVSPQASFSAGECELLAFATGFTSQLDAVLAGAAAQGRTLFVSSGDTGAACPLPVVGVNGVPGGLPGQNYPASSPYVTAVGGTSILGAGLEIGWYAGGGGPSLVENAPAYQAGAGGSYLGVHRGVPDVALDADPQSGYDVVVNGATMVIGGTSASAPAWQGIWARAQSAHGGALGFADPVLYKTLPASAFTDIVLGANPLPATPGWDYVTGRGVPNIAAVAAAA